MESIERVMGQYDEFAAISMLLIESPIAPYLKFCLTYLTAVVPIKSHGIKLIIEGRRRGKKVAPMPCIHIHLLFLLQEGCGMILRGKTSVLFLPSSKRENQLHYETAKDALEY